jgi:type IV pilus assembly protein PilE
MRLRGFTLIELMITVAVVGILAAVAYPSYLDHIRRSRRSAAQAVMLEIAQKQMQLFLDVRGYSAAADETAIAAAPLRVSIDSKVSAAYSFSVTATNPANAPPTFLVTAAPLGGQVADKCGTMTLNHLSAKTPATGCW